MTVAPQLGSRGQRVIICPPFRYANLRYVRIGDGVLVNRDCWIHVLRPRPGEPVPELVIGPHRTIGMGATISAARRIVLGRHVIMARNVYISDHRHAFEDVHSPCSQQGITNIRPTSIGDETWLGQNVCILPGVQIGKHCVIGANSTVTTDIDDYSVAVGSPARIVKHYDFGLRRWMRGARNHAVIRHC